MEEYSKYLVHVSGLSGPAYTTIVWFESGRLNMPPHPAPRLGLRLQPGPGGIHVLARSPPGQSQEHPLVLTLTV